MAVSRAQTCFKTQILQTENCRQDILVLIFMSACLFKNKVYLEREKSLS